MRVRRRPSAVSVEDRDNLVTMAMNGWSAPEPAWWLHLQSQPEATIQTRDGVRLVRVSGDSA
jgi:F420H(2)-dependent quinone reductase